MVLDLQELPMWLGDVGDRIKRRKNPSLSANAEHHKRDGREEL